jgi:hypothetical protein
MVTLVDVICQQLRRVRIGAAQQNGLHAFGIGGQPRGVQCADVLRDRHQHLAPKMAALLFRCELILEMHARGAGSDHRLHQFERVQRATEACLSIGDDRRHPVGAVVALGVRDLVGAAQGGVDPLHDVRHRVHRIQRLVGIHLAGGVGIRRHLPAGQVDRLQSRLDLLHCLIAGQRAERRHEGLSLQQVPQPCRTYLGEAVADSKAARQAYDFFGHVIAADARKTLRILAGTTGTVRCTGRSGVGTHLAAPVPGFDDVNY